MLRLHDSAIYLEKKNLLDENIFDEGKLGNFFRMQLHSEICLPFIPFISFQHFKGLPQNHTH